MPPRTPEEIAKHRLNNLVGLFAVSVLFFVITWLVGRSQPHPATPWLLWFFGLLAGACLAGWFVMSARRLDKLDRLSR